MVLKMERKYILRRLFILWPLALLGAYLSFYALRFVIAALMVITGEYV